MALEIAPFVVFGILIVAAVVVIVDLGALPGKIARGRGHPQADAVNAAGWIGLVTGVLWPIAFVWAFFHPRAPGAGGRGSSGSGVDDDRLPSLESRLRRVEVAAGAPESGGAAS